MWVLLRVRLPKIKGEKQEVSLRAFTDGLRFIRSQPLIWSSMLLDFFAAFFSSAMALLPVYASDILKAGEAGYGVLYAAANIGALCGALLVAQWGRKLRQQGKAMLAAVAVYGMATILFGVSEVFWLSFIALFITGLADSISVVVRNTLRQLLTPDNMRGRMLSINMIFFLGGPQLGELEAGVMARVVSPVFSVVSGGVGTLIALGVIAATVPTLRAYREPPKAISPTA